MGFILIVLLFQQAVCFSQTAVLSNGSYQVRFTQGGGPDYGVRILDSVYIRLLSKTDSSRGRLIWLSPNRFQFDFFINDPSIKRSSLLETLQQSFGDHCIELLLPKKDTIPFRTTYTGNLHVSINEGYFLRVHDKP